jgi:hypothetical protein
VLYLFRYDPLGRTLAQLEEMIGRTAPKGLDVSAERAELEAPKKRHAALTAGARPARIRSLVGGLRRG